MAEIYLTREGKEKLIKELQELQKRKPLIQDEIARAREHGDLRENAEYHAAKETLTNLMRRIMELDTKISSAKIIEEQNIDPDKIFIGVTITIQDETNDSTQWREVGGARHPQAGSALNQTDARVGARTRPRFVGTRTWSHRPRTHR